MKAEASLARKTAAPTRSLGSPSLLKGVFSIPHCCREGSDHTFRVRSVRMNPGAMELTLIPFGPHSAANDRVMPTIPNLLIA